MIFQCTKWAACRTLLNEHPSPSWPYITIICGSSTLLTLPLQLICQQYIRSKLLLKQAIRLYSVEHIQLRLLSFRLLCLSTFYACPTNTALRKLSNSSQGSCKVRGPWTGWTYLSVHYSLSVHVELQQIAPSNIKTHLQCNMPTWLQEHTKFQQQKTNKPYEA